MPAQAFFIITPKYRYDNDTAEFRCIHHPRWLTSHNRNNFPLTSWTTLNRHRALHSILRRYHHSMLISRWLMRRTPTLLVIHPTLDHRSCQIPPLHRTYIDLQNTFNQHNGHLGGPGAQKSSRSRTCWVVKWLKWVTIRSVTDSRVS